jgi:hypothetical protein
LGAHGEAVKIPRSTAAGTANENIAAKSIEARLAEPGTIQTHIGIA